jgi:predicted DCC family thiol-disulfide oxidoreductase YuxK
VKLAEYFVLRTIPLRVSRGITHGSPFARTKAATGSTSTLAAARPPTIATQPIIILFDGVCNLCSGMVRFVIARRMSFPWPMFGVFRVLPRGLRDALYRFVARNRYRWFGRAEACMVPRVELQERFLD